MTHLLANRTAVSEFQSCQSAEVFAVKRPTPQPQPVLRYQVAGHGEPVVLVHGLCGSTRWWAKNIDALAAWYRVYTVDLAGFGRSRRCGRFVLEDAAGQLAAWMDSVGLPHAAFVGHSMGGLIVTQLALQAPERVDHLVLVNPTLIPFAWGYGGHLLRMARALPRVPISFLAVLVTDTLRAGLWPVWQVAQQLLAADIHQELGRVTQPVLAIWGEQDDIVPPALGVQVVAAIPGARLAVIEGAGHVPMWERPSVFNRTVLGFLGQETHVRSR
ncbi:MAG: hypothetical protein QOF51_939 [Chloroflexota bacterium]|jgi:pimeloyl-ACP methyl ester carboxylesterase|nr:hypothetical protein [Chloroflexota bacterium]